MISGAAYYIDAIVCTEHSLCVCGEEYLHIQNRLYQQKVSTFAAVVNGSHLSNSIQPPSSHQ